MPPQPQMDEWVMSLMKRYPGCKVERHLEATEAHENFYKPFFFVGQPTSLERDEGRWDLRRHCILAVVGNTFDTDAERPMPEQWIRSNHGRYALIVGEGERHEHRAYDVHLVHSLRENDGPISPKVDKFLKN